MKKLAAGLGVFFVAVCMVLAAGEALTAEKAKPNKSIVETVVIRGVVVAHLNDKGKISKVQLIAKGGKVYHIALNKNGIKLAKQMNAKEAKVTARLILRRSRKKPVRWLQVKRFRGLGT
jgi:hypothetical protein